MLAPENQCSLDERHPVRRVGDAEKEHLIGNYWQIKIDGVIRGNFVFSSARMAADEAMKLIDTGSFT